MRILDKMMTGEVASDLAALYGQNLTKIVEDNIRLKVRESIFVFCLKIFYATKVFLFSY